MFTEDELHQRRIARVSEDSQAPRPDPNSLTLSRELGTAPLYCANLLAPADGHTQEQKRALHSLNAAMQLLISMPLLRDKVMNMAHSKHGGEGTTNVVNSSEVSKEIGRFLLCMHKPRGGAGVDLAPLLPKVSALEEHLEELSQRSQSPLFNSEARVASNAKSGVERIKRTFDAANHTLPDARSLLLDLVDTLAAEPTSIVRPLVHTHYRLHKRCPVPGHTEISHQRVLPSDEDINNHQKGVFLANKEWDMHAPARLEVGVKPELKLNITFNQFACQKPVSPRLRKSKTCNETLTPSYGVKNYPEYLFIKVIRRANGMFHCSPVSVPVDHFDPQGALGPAADDITAPKYELISVLDYIPSVSSHGGAGHYEEHRRLPEGKGWCTLNDTHFQMDRVHGQEGVSQTQQLQEPPLAPPARRGSFPSGRRASVPIAAIRQPQPQRTHLVLRNCELLIYSRTP